MASANRSCRRSPKLPALGRRVRLTYPLTRLFQLANARLFLRFRSEQLKKRRVNRVAGGVLTFGDAPPPIKVYQGPTARTKLETVVAPSATPIGKVPNEAIYTGSGQEGGSLGNMNRGDRI